VLIAAAGVVALALVATLATGHRGERLVQGIGRGLDNRLATAGFRLKSVHIQGASPMATADIVRAAGVYADEPLVGLDLGEVRRRVEGVGWVKQARIVRLLPDTLVVVVDERKQLAVWQHGGKTMVIDDHGEVIPEADPARFAGLPLVVGEGAATAAPGLLPILAQRPRLMQLADALVRVDDRRWDIRLKDGSLIQLPSTGEDQALMQLEQLDQRSHILELGFDRIDLRNPDLVAVRPRQTEPGRPAAAGARQGKKA
jgi:cell division protein FtsQ